MLTSGQCLHRYIRGLRNQSKQQPYEHTGYQTLLLLHEEHHDVDDLLVAAEAATSDQLRAFVQGPMLRTLAVDILVSGDVDAALASRLAGIASQPLLRMMDATPREGPVLSGDTSGRREVVVRRGPHAPTGHRPTTTIRIPRSAELLLEVPPPNGDDQNSAAQVIFQIGTYGDDTAAPCRLLAMIMKEPCFSRLRTKEQLGYIVFRYDAVCAWLVQVRVCAAVEVL